MISDEAPGPFLCVEVSHAENQAPTGAPAASFSARTRAEKS